MSTEYCSLAAVSGLAIASVNTQRDAVNRGLSDLARYFDSLDADAVSLNNKKRILWMKLYDSVDLGWV